MGHQERDSAGPADVLVLGGAGEIGRHVTSALAEDPGIAQITIADVDAAGAARVAEALGSQSVNAASVDLRDRRRLVELARGNRLLVNCTPFPWFDNVIDGAIEAGVDYADLISEPTERQRTRARDAGITAISGLGLTPGTTNVLAAHGAASFDDVLEFHIDWVSHRTIAPSEGLLETILWELREDCATRQYFHNGRFVRVRPFEGSRVVTFAPPVGIQTVYFVPHTETVTLPVHFPTVRFVAVRGTWRSDLMTDIRVLNRYGLLDDVRLDGNGAMTPFAANRARIWQKLGGKKDSDFPWAFFAHVEVIGRRGRATYSRHYQIWHDVSWGTDATGRMTGVNAGVGVLLLARNGGREGRGFIDPEAYFAPDDYLAQLTRCSGIHVSVEEEALATDPAERSKEVLTHE